MVCPHKGKHTAPQRELLPADVVPTHYRLFLEPELEKYSYSGHVEIDIDVKNATNKVSVNTIALNLHKAELNFKPAINTTEDTEKQQVTWEFGETLPSGSKATLRIEFDGELNDKMCGFYRSVHSDSDGKEHVVAATQMEATDCRRAFPCFDEPSLKATFDISIAAEKNLVVLSNSDVKNAVPFGSDKTITHFNTTPKMSTYLVAFVIGDLSYVESNLFRLPVRVYATPGLEDRCQYSADLAARTLEFFENVFGIEYPLPKCDMIGLHDFSAGAMENWGLITYRLTTIFYTEGKDSQATKLRVTEVVQHELAHQWFGNLVTMDWWDGLWLNEGFATWMSWYACDAFYPEWKVWESYLNKAYQSCLNFDGLRSSHPVEVPVYRAQDVDEIFDTISYLKGSCVIRMVSTILGEETFIKGISKYLHRHQYGNTVTTDLWRALSDVSGTKVDEFMGIWTKTAGYPLLSVSQVGDKNEITVTQNRFLSTNDLKPEENETLYPVILDIRNSDGKVDHKQILMERTGTFEVTSAEFFKLNANQNGIFRVKYSDEIFSRIVAEGTKGDKSLLSTEDRLGLLGDLSALRGIQVSSGQVLMVAQQWVNDPSPNVLLKILSNLSAIAGQLFFQDEEVKEHFRRFRAAFVIPLADKYGYAFPNGGDALESELKSALFASAIAVGDPKYIKIATDMYNESKFDVIPDIKLSIFRAVAEYGTPEQWEELKQHYLEGSNGTSGEWALLTLAYTKDAERIKSLLRMTLDHTIRMQDARGPILGVFAASKMAADIGWKWFTENWNTISKEFPVSGRILGNIVQAVVQGISTKEHLANVDAFFKDKELSGNERLYATAHDFLVKQVSTLDRDVQEVAAWLKSESKL